MTYILMVASIVSAYLIGSFPSAYIAGRLRKGTDIRQEGSKNMGVTNVFYNVGIRKCAPKVVAGTTLYSGMD